MRKSIHTQRTAHYHVQEGKDVKEILYIIHGYGQLAEEFLAEFSYLKEKAVTIIAPEALSKFYNKDKKAVANWMTSHEREDEIKDYVNYLNNLHQKIKETYGVSRFSILGFSQGTSTALRWMKESQINFKNAYICSSSVPPEIKVGDLAQHKDCQFIYYYGDDDPLIAPQKADLLIENFRSFVVKLEVVHFKGRHEISWECKAKIASEIIS